MKGKLRLIFMFQFTFVDSFLFSRFFSANIRVTDHWAMGLLRSVIYSLKMFPFKCSWLNWKFLIFLSDLIQSKKKRERRRERERERKRERKKRENDQDFINWKITTSKPGHVPLMEMPDFLIQYLYHYWDQLHLSTVTLGSCLVLSILFQMLRQKPRSSEFTRELWPKNGGQNQWNLEIDILDPKRGKEKKKTPAISPVMNLCDMINLLYFNCSGKTILSM